MPTQKTIQEQYASITYSDAQTKLLQRFSATNGTFPTKEEIEARRAFDAGDHWQEGRGFIGQLPSGEQETERTELLKKAFSPEDIISEVLDTHVENVLGNDPIISLIREGQEPNADDAELTEILEAIKEWFDKRENVKVLADALRGARRETARVLRAFIPVGMINGEGRIEAKDLREALSKIWIRSEPIENGGVIVDEATATELGLMLYAMEIEQTKVQLCEYAFLDRRETVWGTSSNGAKGAEVAEPFLLNGALPIYQMDAKALITNSVCQAQRDVNLSGTMLTRNNNLAGSRERLAIGVQPPGSWAETTDEAGTVTRNFTPAAMNTGPATFNFLSAQALYDEEGLVKSLANPNIIFTDPVPVNTFLETSQHWRTVIYSKAKMRHLLLADSATASGKSRIEARKEFQSSLNESKGIVDPAGKWMVEIALNIAAHFIGKPGEYLKTCAVFDAQVSTIELTPEEIQEIRDDYEAGMIDLRTALELRGFDNVDEIMERIDPVDPSVIEARRLPNA